MTLKVWKPHLTSYIQEHKYLMEGGCCKEKRKKKSENKHWVGWYSVGFPVTSKIIFPLEPSIQCRSSPQSGGNQTALCCLTRDCG